MNMLLDFSIFTRGEYPEWILKGIITMLELSFLAWFLACFLAVVLAVLRMSSSRIGKIFATAFVEYHQNVPLLVQIFIWYFGVPSLLPQETQQWINSLGSEFIYAFIAIGLCMGAYMAEDLRGGIRSIPPSQLEASRALGLSYLQAARKVIIPQAIRIALPPLINHTVLLFKNTSLAMTIGVIELTYVTKEIESQSFQTIEIYLFTTIFYLCVSILIMVIGEKLERRFRIVTR
jgi:polar amino acid transport system permease protein